MQQIGLPCLGQVQLMLAACISNSPPHSPIRPAIQKLIPQTTADMQCIIILLSSINFASIPNSFTLGCLMVNVIPQGFDCMGSTKAVLQKREAVLTSTDRTFKVEMSFMTGMVGEGGQSRPSLIQINPIPLKKHDWQVQTSWYELKYGWSTNPLRLVLPMAGGSCSPTLTGWRPRS